MPVYQEKHSSNPSQSSEQKPSLLKQVYQPALLRMTRILSPSPEFFDDEDMNNDGVADEG